MLTRETRLRLIMAIITIPLWLACMVMLCGVYLYAGFLNLRDRLHPVQRGLIALALLSLIAAALFEQYDRVVFPAQDFDPVYAGEGGSGFRSGFRSEWEYNAYWFIVMVNIAEVAALGWMFTTIYCSYKIAYILYRWHRWQKTEIQQPELFPSATMYDIVNQAELN